MISGSANRSAGGRPLPSSAAAARISARSSESNPSADSVSPGIQLDTRPSRKSRARSPAGAADALSLQIDLVEWSARELHLPIGGKRPGSLRWFLADDADDAKVAAWEATPGLEAQPSDLAAPAAASEHLAKKPAAPLKPKDAGFLAAKSPLPPTTLGNLIKDYRDHAKGGVGKGYEAKKPTGSAAGNTGRAQRPS